MGANTTAEKKIRKKFIEHDKTTTTTTKWRQVVKCLLDIYGLSAHAS